MTPAARRLLAAAAIVLGLASVVSHAREWYDPIRFSKDVGLDYASARAITRGENPYAPMRGLVVKEFGVSRAYADALIVPGANWHTPFTFLLVAPLTALPYRAAGLTWLALSAAAIVASVALIGKELGWPRGVGLVAGVGALALPVVQKDLSLGHINGTMLLLLAGAWAMLRRERDTAAGVLIGVAAAVKLYPALLVLPLLAARRWRAAAATASTSALLAVVSVAAARPRFLADLFETGRTNFAYFDTAPTNVSWWGLANRWIAPNGWTPDLGVGWLGFAVGIAGVAVLLGVASRRRDLADPSAFWGVLLVLVLAWPIAWDHYLVLAIPWVVLAATGRRPALLLVAAVLAVGVPPGTPGLTGPVNPAAAGLLYQLPTLALVGVAAFTAFGHRMRGDGVTAPDIVRGREGR